MKEPGHPNTPLHELEQQVNQLRTELEASNRALDAFSYSVSHDLRAPLRKIGYFTEMLVETYQGKLDTKASEWLNKLNGQAREMTHMIDVLLEFSRTGRKTPEMIAVNMTEMVNILARDAGSKDNSRNICFTIHPLPEISADPDLIRQVWTNLLSNAIKYTAREKDTQIEIGADEKPGAVLYYIKDNGVGFDMKYAEKLFTPFQRLHSRSEFEGTGIGLATAERIIAKHNGRIWAEAAMGEGAAFYFELPK